MAGGLGLRLLKKVKTFNKFIFSGFIIDDVIGESGEANRTFKVTFLGNINHADYGVRGVVFAGLAYVGTAFRIFRRILILEILEEVISFGKIVNLLALPMGSSEDPMIFAAFGDYDFAIFTDNSASIFF